MRAAVDPPSHGRSGTEDALRNQVEHAAGIDLERDVHERRVAPGRFLAGAVFSRPRMGFAAPRARRGNSSGSRSASRRRALSVAARSPALPATVVMSSTRSSGERNASTIASASSMPGSVSMTTGRGLERSITAEFSMLPYPARKFRWATRLRGRCLTERIPAGSPRVRRPRQGRSPDRDA